MDNNEIIAEWLETYGRKAPAYEQALVCQHGHDSQIVIDDGSGLGSGEHWADDVEWQPGGLCLSCMIFGTVSDDWYDTLWKKYAEAMEIRRKYQADLSYHPEWRIPAVPVDFTKLEYLIPAIETWRNLNSDRSWWVGASGTPVDSDYHAYAEILNENNQVFVDDAETAGMALREVLAQMLAEEENF